MSPVTLSDFSEEVLERLVLFPVDDTQYHDGQYPAYNAISCDIMSLSLVNQQFHRLCLPFLFAYIKCESVAELAKLKHKCVVEPTFAGLVRTLDLIGAAREDSSGTSDILLNLLRHLSGILWLDLRGMTINPILLTAINDHRTLKTVVVWDAASFHPQIPVEKLLLTATGPAGWQSAMSDVQKAVEYGAQIVAFSTASFPVPFSTVMPALRHFILEDTQKTEKELEEFGAFVVNHPTLTDITFYTAPPETFWDGSGGLTKRQLELFIEAVKRQSLVAKLSLQSLGLSPLAPNVGFTSWEVTRLSFEMVEPGCLAEALVLAGTMFPKVSALSLSFPINYDTETKMHIDAFMALIRNHFSNLRALHLDGLLPFLTFAPWQVPMAKDATFPGCAAVACEYGGPECWVFRADYSPRRDYTGVVLRMQVDGTTSLQTDQESEWQETPFRESATVDYFDIDT
ncbi:hypothetical protein C8J56DRAFT_963665 [Mycena floridula]|nr:hypothetical protein C8J56DRAFT_963665 [Mycena floridula]